MIDTLKKFQDWLPGFLKSIWQNWTDIKPKLDPKTQKNVQELSMSDPAKEDEHVVGALSASAYYAKLNSDLDEKESLETIQDIRVLAAQQATIPKQEQP